MEQVKREGNKFFFYTQWLRACVHTPMHVCFQCSRKQDFQCIWGQD